MMFNNSNIISSSLKKSDGDREDDLSHMRKANVHCSICTNGATDEELAQLLEMHHQDILNSYYQVPTSAGLAGWYIAPKHKYSPDYLAPLRRYSPLKGSAGILGQIMDEGMTSTEDRIERHMSGEGLCKNTLASTCFPETRREVHSLRGLAGESMKRSFRQWNTSRASYKPRLRADLVQKLHTPAGSVDVLVDGARVYRSRQDDRMLPLAAEAQTIASSASPYQAELTRLRMERLQMEEQRTTIAEEQSRVEEEQSRVEEEQPLAEEEQLQERTSEEELESIPDKPKTLNVKINC